MSDKGSVAPKERINIVYKPATGNQQEQVELPMKLMVLADFKGGEDTKSLEERKTVNVSETSLDDVISHYAPKLNISVANKLSDDPKADDLSLELNFKAMDDFSPDNLARSFPEVSKLMELRDALRALKGPLGNVAQFRRHLEQVVQDDTARAALLKELNIQPAAPAKNAK
jgi:type VI secretion system protein ImpB